MGYFAHCALLVMLSLALTAGSAHANDPQLARTLTDEGILKQERSAHDEALKLFDAALVQYDHPKIRYFRAKSLLSLGRIDEALVEFDGIRFDEDVAKYHPEIEVFIRDIHRQRDRNVLEAELEAERKARAAAEAKQRALERVAEAAEIAKLRAHRIASLYPPNSELALGGAGVARMAPLVPTQSDPVGTYEGAIKALEHADALQAYQTELALAKGFTLAAVVGLSVGVGLGANPLRDGDVSQGTQQAGLVVGAVGVISGLVALVLWPSEPQDIRPPMTPDEDADAVAGRP